MVRILRGAARQSNTIIIISLASTLASSPWAGKVSRICDYVLEMESIDTWTVMIKSPSPNTPPPILICQSLALHKCRHHFAPRPEFLLWTCHVLVFVVFVVVLVDFFAVVGRAASGEGAVCRLQGGSSHPSTSSHQFASLSHPRCPHLSPQAAKETPAT